MGWRTAVRRGRIRNGEAPRQSNRIGLGAASGHQPIGQARHHSGQKKFVATRKSTPSPERLTPPSALFLRANGIAASTPVAIQYQIREPTRAVSPIMPTIRIAKRQVIAASHRMADAIAMSACAGARSLSALSTSVKDAAAVRSAPAPRVTGSIKAAIGRKAIADAVVAMTANGTSRRRAALIEKAFACTARSARQRIARRQRAPNIPARPASPADHQSAPRISCSSNSKRARARSFSVLLFSCPHAARMSRPRGVRTGDA